METDKYGDLLINIRRSNNMHSTFFKLKATLDFL